SLGTHASRPLPTGAEPGDARLVLVVRGDLLKKYPTAVVYAQQARWRQEAEDRFVRELDDSNPDLFVKAPIFKAEIEPDVRFLGFDLTAGGGQSRLVFRDPGAPRRAALRSGRSQRRIADTANQLERACVGAPRELCEPGVYRL